MGTISNILNGNSGLSARQKLLILLDFYNQFVNSDGSYNLQSFSSKKTLEFKGATDGFSKIEFIPTDGGPGIINIYNSAGVIKTTINGLTGITSTNFRVPGATAAHFLKGNGTLDNTAYQTALVNGLADVLGINPSTGNIPLKSPNGLNSMGVIDSAVGGAFNDGAGNTGSYGSDATKTYIGHSNRVDITSPINTITGENHIQSTNQYVTVLIRDDIAMLFFKDSTTYNTGSVIANNTQTEIFHTVKISLNSNLIEVSQDPTTPLGVATKNYVNNLIDGIDYKPNVKVSTTVNITLSGIQNLDGVTGAVDMRVTVRFQITASDNGIYLMKSGAWVRSTDGDTGLELEYAVIPIESGTLYGGKVYRINQTGIVLGTTAITFTEWNVATYVNGMYLSLTGNVFDVNTSALSSLFELAAHKQNSLATDGTGTKIPTVDAVNAGIANAVNYQTITIASNATPTIAIGTFRETFVDITALATAVTSFTTNLTGTPTNGARMTIRIKDNGTARALAFGTSFEACGVSLPTTTTISKRTTIGFVYDITTSKWGCVASITES